MRPVSPTLVVALLERRVREFGPITKENAAEVTRWLMAEVHAQPDRDHKLAQISERDR